MRFILIALLLVGCYSDSEPELGSTEQEVWRTCIEDPDCDDDPNDCKYGWCNANGVCAINQLTGTTCQSDGIPATNDVCRSGSCAHETQANSCYGKCGQANTAGTPGGCSCDANCESADLVHDGDSYWSSNGCCPDMATYCAPTLASASSCVGRCGERAPGGCSCDATCGYTGTCCSDIVAACPAAAPVPPFPNPLAPGAGTELFQTSPSVGIAAGVQSLGPENLGSVLQFKKPVAPAVRTIVGFSKLNFNKVEAFDEEAHCSIVETAASKMRLVQAGTRHHDDRDELHAHCKGIALRFPNAANKPAPTVGAEVRIEQHNGGSANLYTLGAATATSIAVLTHMQVGNTDHYHPAACTVYEGGGLWKLHAWSVYDDGFSGDGSDVWCGARLVTWDPSLGLVREAEVNVTAPYEHHQVLGSVYGRTCFLTGMTHAATKSTCEITSVNDDWVLRIKAGDLVNPASPIRCRATCLSYPAEWPRTPVLRGIASTDPTGVIDARVPQGPIAAAGAEQPSQPADLPRGIGAGPGGVLNLYRSADNIYDRPILIVEGFDPGNDQGANSYMRGFGPVLRTLQDRYGIDVWVLKPSGGRDIRVTAREIAKALSNIYTYDHDGVGIGAPAWNVSPARELPVIGMSQGALGTRIALATWEQGNRYQNAAHGEYVPGLISNPTPPVSLFVSLNGPHREAIGSTTLQTVITSVFNGMDSITLPASIYGMLASTAAKQMMRTSVAASCRSVVTQECDGGVFGELYDAFGPENDGNFQIRGLQGRGHYDFATNGDWAVANQSAYQNTGCNRDSLTHDAFYADIDARGTGLRNGFPQTVHSVAISNGSFSPQGCKNFDGSGCSTPAPYNVTVQNDVCDYVNDPNCNRSNMPDGTTFAINPDRFVAGGPSIPYASSVAGVFNFYFTGVMAGGMVKACDRDTTVHFLLSNEDLTPGDHRGKILESTIDAIPAAAGQVTRLDGQDFFPLVFVPTESALSCPAVIDSGACVLGANGQRPHAACDALCRTANRNDNRFKNVLSNPTDKNGAHASINRALAMAVVAYVHEFAVQDADGYFDPASEWGLPDGEQLDCSSTSALIGSSATSSCTTACGSQGTKTCTGGTWGSCAAPVEMCNGIDDNCDGSIDEGCPSGGGGGGGSPRKRVYY